MVRISGAVFSACTACAALGTVIKTPKQVLRSAVEHKLTETIPSLDSKPELVVSDFAQRIRAARQRTGLKQEQLAKKLNEKVSIISALETGRRFPDLKLARKLERFFGIKLVESEE